MTSSHHSRSLWLLARLERKRLVFCQEISSIPFGTKVWKGLAGARTHQQGRSHSLCCHQHLPKGHLEEGKARHSGTEWVKRFDLLGVSLQTALPVPEWISHKPVSQEMGSLLPTHPDVFLSCPEPRMLQRNRLCSSLPSPLRSHGLRPERQLTLQKPLQPPVPLAPAMPRSPLPLRDRLEGERTAAGGQLQA